MLLKMSWRVEGDRRWGQRLGRRVEKGDGEEGEGLKRRGEERGGPDVGCIKKK